MSATAWPVPSKNDAASARLAVAGADPRHRSAGFLRLIDAFGSAAAALDANSRQTEPLIGKEAAAALRGREAEAAADSAQQWAQTPGCQLVSLLDDDYPPQLAESGSPPPLLFARGRRELLAHPMLAIVGSRAATPQGRQNAESFASELAEHGYCIVSGMASGIDAAAHHGALTQPASTIAVVGTGIDRVYPAGNRQLAHRIAEEGLILSEFALGMGPLAGHFPRRNRIIAGLSRGCLVAEANTGSGSLITARLAMENNREVMAIPGSIHNPQSRGCHRLIKDGAKLVETVDDVLDEVGRLQRQPPRAQPAVVAAESPLLEAMGFDPISIDALSTTLGLTVGSFTRCCSNLSWPAWWPAIPAGFFNA